MIIPRNREQSRRTLAMMAAIAAGLAPSDAPAGETKVAGGTTYAWVDQACARAEALQKSGCDPNGVGGRCQPVQVGIPQGAGAGVIATTATGVFTLPAPANIIPYQLILHGNAIGFQVVDLSAGLMGPLLAGLATSPIGGDAFGANVNEPVPLKAITIPAGVNIVLTLVNPTLGNLTFVGSYKVVVV